MDVAIIDYQMSNLHSVQAACEKAGLQSIITSDSAIILDSKVAILPGVGAFGHAMSKLAETKLDECIFRFVETGKPFIGICLGLQLLFESSEEFGSNSGLGLVEGKVKKFKFCSINNIKFPVPQIGWNQICKSEIAWENTLLSKNIDHDFMYFVHSFYVKPKDKKIILSSSTYGDQDYCSSLEYKNIFATQFHPEKSGNAGMNIYKKIKIDLEKNN